MLSYIKKSIFTQLLFVIAGTSIFTALVSGIGHSLFTSHLLKTSMHKQVATALQLTTDYLEHNYTKALSDDLNVLRSSQSIDALLKLETNENAYRRLMVEQLLLSLSKNRDKLYHSARLISNDGKELAIIQSEQRIRHYNTIQSSPPTTLNLRISELFFKLKRAKAGAIIFSRPAFQEDKKLFLVGINISDIKGEHFRGAIVISFIMDDFIDYLKNFKVFDHAMIWLFTHTGETIFEVKAEKIANPYPYIFSTKKKPDNLLIYHSNKKEEHSLGNILKIVISLPPQIRTNLLQDSFIITALILIIIVTIACIIAYITAVNIIRPIRQLTDKSQKVAAGDLSVSIAITGENELSILARTFNLMVNELEEQHYELQSLAHKDTLTQLPNRRQFEEYLTSCIRNCQRASNKLSVIYIDLDQFKDTNDALGHPAGDKLICGVAKRLSTAIRQTDLVARLGGDEFAIIINPHKTRTDTEHIAKKILQNLNKPFSIDGHQVFSGGSIGISIYPDHGKDAITLVKNADAAMYKTKNMGRNSYQFYSANLTEKANERILLGSLIRKALESEEFEIHYQPKLSLDNEQLIGAEALFRWNNNEPHITTEKVFAIAESTGFVEKLDDWIINHVFQQIKIWTDKKIPLVPISVNISGMLMERNLVVDILKKALHTHTIDPKLIEIEITENYLISDYQQTQKTLEIIHALGIKVAIDDFGTGYSSLSYLKDMKADTLKIDRKFVVNAMENHSDKEIATAIVNLACSLNMHVVVEGIESSEQASFFRELGAHSAQGFLYAAPMPSKEFTHYLSEQLNYPSKQSKVIKL